MSAMSAAGLAATSAATNSYPVLFVYFLVYCICVFHVQLLYLSISCVWSSFLGLFLTPRLRYAQLSHRGHDLVHLGPQVLFKVFLLLAKLDIFQYFLTCTLSVFFQENTSMWSCDNVSLHQLVLPRNLSRDFHGEPKLSSLENALVITAVTFAAGDIATICIQMPV